ncbi:MAG: hypothetical protein COT00_05145 [Candidatus Omnitrophica bacterium CG07_land_8_20_14_0_80_50_8]|nr:MAG: hypothetical protein AUJ71_03355 [Candidatus Omnitrophica bacterium CG1_02_49_16]PIU39792.1 MAG: hypothetical protein COT00_05145 [Candidatus Omnitrophica bacterium CG07_land_8_20_14_0_80_50_8]
MHEANFTKQIVEAVVGALRQCPDGKPRTVKVQVGAMLHLVPESVQMHYQLLTRGTGLEGIGLELTETPVRVRCRRCGHEGGVEDHHLLLCTACDSMEVELTAGDQILIDSIECEVKS